MKYDSYDMTGWQKLEGDALNGCLETLNRLGHAEIPPFAASHSRACWRALHFYDAVGLVRVNDTHTPPHHLTQWYVARSGQFLRLDSSSRNIFALNRSGALRLNAECLAEYVGFFCWFVKSSGVRLRVLAGRDDIPLYGDIPTALSDRIFTSIKPPICLGRDTDGRWLLEASVLWRDCLFVARFAVSHDGMIEMIDDETIAVGLPTEPHMAR